MLSPDEALKILRECGAFLEGHFLLSSGRHSDQYVEKFRLLEHPELTARFAETLAAKLGHHGAELVIGPLTGGLLVAHETAKLLGLPLAFPERIEGRMQFRRGFQIRKGQKVLICEDVITTGKSVGEAAQAVRQEGGEVVVIACLVRRGKTDLKPEPVSVLDLDLQSWLPQDCPLCKKNIPLEKRGSR